MGIIGVIQYHYTVPFIAVSVRRCSTQLEHPDTTIQILYLNFQILFHRHLLTRQSTLCNVRPRQVTVYSIVDSLERPSLSLSVPLCPPLPYN